jgi:uncharacterized membrane protein YciS (DUF1049 family)
MKIKTMISRVFSVIEGSILEGIIYIAIKVTIYKINRKKKRENAKSNKK